MSKPLRLICAAVFLFALAPPSGQADSFTDDMAEAAQGWINAMGDKVNDGRFDFTDVERFDWHYTPKSRNGVVLSAMSEPQRDALKKLMRTTMSSPGILKAQAVMALEGVLAEIEGSSLSYRDPEKYFVSVFGEPGQHPWGWRLEGHHLSINVTVPSKETADVSVTPTFIGTNPARIPSGPREGARLQHDEFILGIRIARNLSAEQMMKAMLQDRSLGNIVAGPGRGDAFATRQGLPVSEMTDTQRRLLTQLIAAYVGMARDEIGWPYMKLVHAGLNETTFAWAGGISETEPFYYRIHGPRRAAFAGLDDEDKARPIVFVGPGAPPALLLHGAADTTVVPEHSLRLADALRKEGVPATSHLYPDVTHGPLVAAMSEPLEFLAPTLKHTVDYLKTGQVPVE